MRDLSTLVFALCLLINGLAAQNNPPAYAKIQSQLFHNNQVLEWPSALEARHDPATGQVQISTDSLESGFNLLAIDLVNDWKMYVQSVRTAEQLTVVGFAVQYQDGRMVYINSASPLRESIRLADPNGGDHTAQHFSHAELPLRISYTHEDGRSEPALLPEYDF